MKKTGLGRDPLKWIQPTISEKKAIEKEIELKISQEKQEKKETSIPKFKTFEVRLTSLLREDQLDFLEKLTREIQKNRVPEFRKERITKNTLIRVFIDAFMDTKIDTTNIPDEETLLKRVKERIK
ncbi:MAG: hypothetical protein NC905_02050 [Candidatus Omnitrophica bacterium]|nr:hypothetical protein [Candidatus Omnitrophota bacterium]